MFKNILERLVKPTLTIDRRDAEVIRKVVSESGIEVGALKRVFRNLSAHTYGEEPVSRDKMADAFSNDISRVLDKSDIGMAAFIIDELSNHIFNYRPDVVPKTWYRNIHVVLERL